MATSKKKTTIKSKKKSSYNKEERENILDSLSNVPSKTKKKILEDSKSGKFIQSNNDNRGRNSTLGILNYDIDSEDNSHVKFIKERINELKIKPDFIYKRLYEIYGSDTEKCRSDGYNLIYTLRKGILSISRFYLWLNILKIYDFDFTYKSEYFDTEDSLEETEINEDEIDIDEDYYDEE